MQAKAAHDSQHHTFPIRPKLPKLYQPFFMAAVVIKAASSLNHSPSVSAKRDNLWVIVRERLNLSPSLARMATAIVHYRIKEDLGCLLIHKC